MAETALRIPKVKVSPSTLQYQKHKLRRKPFYIPAFSLTKERWEETLAQPWLKKTDPLMPPYPYGKENHFPEANYGLYGGSVIVSGNKISKGRNEGKTVRKWFPNVRFEKIRSEALDKELHIPIRARVMRTIKKCGGLDQYLLGDKPARIKELGLLGWKLRWLVLNSSKMQKQFKEDMEKYGLQKAIPTRETFEEVWNDEEKRKQLVELQDRAWERLRNKDSRYSQHVETRWDPSDRPEHLFADRISYDRGTLHERMPSKMVLPDVENLTVRGKSNAQTTRVTS